MQLCASCTKSLVKHHWDEKKNDEQTQFAAVLMKHSETKWMHKSFASQHSPSRCEMWRNYGNKVHSTTHSSSPKRQRRRYRN